MPPKAAHYRLQALLNYKARMKRHAEVALARAIKKLEEAKKKLEDLKEEKKEIIRKRKESRLDLHHRVGSGTSAAKDSRIHINYVQSLEEDEKAKEKEIEAQKGVIEEAEKAVKRARRDYIDAAKELQVMEKHKELWAKKLQHEINMKEEKEMDELGNIIHQLRVRAGG